MRIMNRRAKRRGRRQFPYMYQRRGGCSLSVVLACVIACAFMVALAKHFVIGDEPWSLVDVSWLSTGVETELDEGVLYEAARVVRVVDGDTLIVAIDGLDKRVRLIGVDAPEIGEPGGDEATQFVRDLVEGQTVWLSGSGNDVDRFGRLRRYVWLQEPADQNCEEQIQAFKLNALLLVHGHAAVMELGGAAHAWARNVVPVSSQESGVQCE